MARCAKGYPDSVIVLYRYAQSLFELGDLDTSDEMYQRAEGMLDGDSQLQGGHWLRGTIPRQHGYLLWTKSLAFGADSEQRTRRIELLWKACVLTKLAFERASMESINRIRAANNYLYYAVEYRGLWQFGDDEVEISDADLKPYLDLVASQVDLGAATFKQINWLDTLCRAYAQMRKFNLAVSAAERLEHLLTFDDGGRLTTSENMPPNAQSAAEPTSYIAVVAQLNDRERDILDHALWVLRNYGPGPETRG